MSGLNRRSYNGGGPFFCVFFYQRRLDKITLVEQELETCIKDGNEGLNLTKHI
jgi:hypothetical protein